MTQDELKKALDKLPMAYGPESERIGKAMDDSLSVVFIINAVQNKIVEERKKPNADATHIIRTAIFCAIQAGLTLGLGIGQVSVIDDDGLKPSVPVTKLEVV